MTVSVTRFSLATGETLIEMTSPPNFDFDTYVDWLVSHVGGPPPEVQTIRGHREAMVHNFHHGFAWHIRECA